MREELTLCRRDGREARFTLRLCTAGDLETILALQECVMAALPDPTLFAPTDREQFAESLEQDICLGIFAGEQAVMVTLLLRNRNTPRHLGHVLGYSVSQLSQCVCYDSSFIHPDWRGYGLQAQLIRIKDDLAREMGAREVLATISPENRHSLRNAEEQGFVPVTRCRLYGGRERWLMRKTL